jgi:hypothetical protein
LTRQEYEERKRALEAQHAADVALMNAAHQARLRTLEDLWQNTGAPARQPQPTAAPERTPAPAPKRRRARRSVLTDLANALPGLPETFDKHDVARVLGYEPSRTTLFRALLALNAEGLITTVSTSIGGTETTRHRKLPPAG